MTLATTSIRSTETYPVDYQILNEDDYIRLIYGNNEEYYQITNRQQIIERRVTDTTNWLLAAGGERNAGDVDDWLEPETGGFKVLYVLAFGVSSDRNVKVKLSNPGSGNYVFGSKAQGEAYVTPSISSIEEPTVTVMALDTTFRPSFMIKNPSEYTLKSCVLGVKGFKYRMSERVDTVDQMGNRSNVPKYYTTINLNNLLEA
jgi:hypothetical protein